MEQNLITINEKPAVGVMQKQSLDQYNTIVGTKPEKYKPRQHPMLSVQKVDNKGNKVKVPLEYYEIGFIEATLDRVYNGLWNDEVTDIKLIANSVVVTVKLWYFNPAMQVWQFKSGVGSAPIQTNAGAGPTDFTQIKSASVQMAAPAAKTYALKNAAYQIGNAFGRHLNREFDFDYTPDERLNKIISVQDQRIEEFISSATSSEKLQEVERHLVKDEHKKMYEQKKLEFDK